MDGHAGADLQQRFDSAAQKFQEAELLDSLRGAALMDCARLLDEVVALRPTDADAHFLLGLTHMRLQRAAEALPHLHAAVALANDHIDHHWQLLQLLLRLGRRSEAIECAERAVLCLPQAALPNKWLSDLYKLERRMDEASASYRRWIELDAAARPLAAKETAKARPRRQAAGFFDKYCRGQGIDIGWGGDLVAPNCRPWDFEDGDAQEMAGLPDESYDFVYSSHNLEHMHEVDRSVLNWWRLVRPGGHLILFLPHRDLFEKRTRLPSRVADHRHYFLPDRDDPPDTIGVLPLVRRLLPEAEILSLETCGAGNSVEAAVVDENGEYSIELVLRKPARP